MSDKKKKDDDIRDNNLKKDENQKELEDILGKISEREQPAEEPSAADKKETEPDSPGNQEGNAGKEEPEGLEDILDKISEKEEAPSYELGFLQRVIGIFVNPSRVFEYLRFKPDYLTPLILTILISMGVSALVYDIALNEQITRIEQNDRIPDEQKNNIIDKMEESRQGPRRIIYNTVVPAIGVLIAFTVVSAIFLFIGNILLGGKAKFVQIFSAYGYAYLVVAIAGTVVKLPLWLSQQTLKVDLSPGIFFPESAIHTTLYRFVSSFDIFTLWFLVVFGIGFAIIYRFSQLKGVLSVSIAWLLYVVITKIALGGFLTGLGG